MDKYRMKALNKAREVMRAAKKEMLGRKLSPKAAESTEVEVVPLKEVPVDEAKTEMVESPTELFPPAPEEEPELGELPEEEPEDEVEEDNSEGKILKLLKSLM